MTSPPDGSGGDGSTAVPSAELWTLREGVQGTAPCAAPSTPPCFDRNAEEQQQQQQQQQQQHAHTYRPPHLLSARGRAGSFDNARSTEGDDEDNQSWSSSSLSSFYRAMMAARTRSISTGNFAGFSSAPGDCERFPPLFRRRTFTEPSRTKSRCLDDGEEEELASASASAAAAAGRDRSGRVPASMSENNMLNLLSNHRDRIPPASTTTLPGRSPSVRPHHCLSEAETPSTDLQAHVLEANSSSVGGGGVTASVRVGTSSSTSASSDESISNGGVDSAGAVGGTAGTTTTATTMTPMQLEEMEEHPPPPSPLPSADSRPRGGSAFMLRLHRAGLMEDTSRCVMDIVEGRAAAAPNAGSSQAAHFGAAVALTAAVTLEPVVDCASDELSEIYLRGVATDGVSVCWALNLLQQARFPPDSQHKYPDASASPQEVEAEVEEHLRSLPERYALTVSPEDVLDHMALFAAVSAAAAGTGTEEHASSSSSSASAQDESLGAELPTVRVVARPSLLALSSSHPAAAGDGEGGMSCGSGLAGVGRAYSLTVACRQCPLLLGAISSSLRSAGASCLDVDVVSTTRTAATRSCGLTLARLEVRVIGGPGLTTVSSAAAAAAAAAGAGGTAASSSASASGWPQRSSVQRGEMEEEEEMSRRLENLFSSTIAAALLLAGDKREGRSGQEEEEEDDDDGAGEREGEAVSPEPPPAGAKRERFGRAGQVADNAAPEDGGGGGGGGGGDGQCSDGGFSRSQPLATTTPRGGTAAAARRAQVTSSSRGTADCADVGSAAQCAGGTATPARGTATTAAAGGASDSNARCCSSSSSRGWRRGNREPLARRQGCFFLSEADANALGSNGNSDASHFGGGGGGGGSASCAKSLGNSSTSNNNDATSNSSNNNNNNNNSNGNNKNGANDSAVFSPCTRSEIGNDGGNTHGGDCRYSTIPPEDIELLELAGKGRFSRTYRATWRGSTVAVKTLELPPEVDREHEAAGAEIVGDGGGSRAVVVAEFERELHIVSNLRHPNVCGFRGVSVSLPHHLSLVYDFLDNGTLGDRLWDTGSSGGGSSGSSSAVHGCGVGGVGGEREWGSRRGRGSEPLRSTDLLRIVTDVVNGMLYLHELGVMHRDLKPDNILLDADDRAVIADFGLSRFSHPTNDHTAETGTYRWMAPEVIRHEPYSQAADVYSFGVVLWQIVARKQPFKGLTPLQAAFSVARQGLRPQIPPSTPPAVARLIRRCWHRSPDSRPSFSQIRSELPEIERQMLSL